MIGCVVCDQDAGWCEFCPDSKVDSDDRSDFASDEERDTGVFVLDIPRDETGWAKREMNLIRETAKGPASHFFPISNEPDIERDEHLGPADRGFLESAGYFPLLPTTTARSYKVTYQIADTFFTRTIIAPDSFLDAVAVAEGQREEGETLINVTELT